jgi:hypothetical protein
MPEYRRRSGSDTWHWCSNCTNWPSLSENSIVHGKKPIPGSGRDLCNECRRKTR